MTSDVTQTALPRPRRNAATASERASTAVILATAPASGGDTPAALLPCAGTTVLGRLVPQLRSVQATEIHVVTRPEWSDAVAAAVAGDDAQVHASPDVAADLRLVAELAEAAPGALTILDGDMIVHREALVALRVAGRAMTAILAAGGLHGEPLTYDVRVRRGRVLSAASPYHLTAHPTTSFLGVLEVAPGDRLVLAAAARELAALSARPPAAWREALARRDSAPAVAAAAREDAVPLLVVGLVRKHARVRPRDVRGLVCARVLSEQDAAGTAARAASADVDRLILDAAVKSDDGFFTTFFVSSYSRHIVRWAARRGLRPNQITVASAVIGLASAAAFATGDRWGLIAGALLLQAAFTADCVDGQLARYTRSSSSFGAWLDSILDRAKEYAVYAGLAIGAGRAGDPLWVLACCALALQTLRHMSDQAFIAAGRQAAAAARQPPLEQPADGPAATSREAAGNGRRLPRASTRATALGWVKQILAFPIGERFAAISVTAALFSPRATFVVLLAWGGYAACYTLTARILRSLST